MLENQSRPRKARLTPQDCRGLILFAAGVLLLLAPTGCATISQTSRRTLRNPLVREIPESIIVGQSPDGELRLPESVQIYTPPFESPVEETGAAMHMSEMKLGDIMHDNLVDLSDDYRNFYGSRNLANLTYGFVVGGIAANTHVDSYIGAKVFENIINVENDEYTELLHLPKSLGDGNLILPLVGALAIAEPWLEQSPKWQPLGEWGNRSLRAALVGGPFVLASQRIIGGSRPNETGFKSDWRPFQDNNGVSGHAFIGAVPFLAAAEMTDRPFLKFAFYAGSLLPGISRINDERHYTSQVFLGWYIAHLATQSVNETKTNISGFQIFPTFDQNGFGLLLDKRF